MDALIENGDNVSDSLGNNLMIDGFDELLQQVIIRIKIPKEKFIYDRSLGSYCRGLDLNACKSREKCFEMLINESLVSLGDAYASVNSVSETAQGIKADITVYSGGKSATREVVI